MKDVMIVFKGAGWPREGPADCLIAMLKLFLMPGVDWEKVYM
jgi:hypothetical protein